MASWRFGSTGTPSSTAQIAGPRPPHASDPSHVAATGPRTHIHTCLPALEFVTLANRRIEHSVHLHRRCTDGHRERSGRHELCALASEHQGRRHHLFSTRAKASSSASDKSSMVKASTFASTGAARSCSSLRSGSSPATPDGGELRRSVESLMAAQYVASGPSRRALPDRTDYHPGGDPGSRLGGDP